MVLLGASNQPPSDFPEDARQAESLLADLGITHILSISPAEIPPSALSATLKSKDHHYHVDVRNTAKEDLLLALPGAVQFLEKAMVDGLVLVHSLMEVRACTVACACLMKRRNLAPDEAYSTIEDALPLFNPTVNFSRNLELFEACGHRPTRDHPVVQEWLSSCGPESGFGRTQSSGLLPSTTRRPSGSIIETRNYHSSTSSSSSPSSKGLKSAAGTQETGSPLRGCPTHTLPTSSSSHQPSVHRKPSRLPTSDSHNILGSSEMDLGARAKDILSNTGLDLTEFAGALKEIERSQAQVSRRSGVNRGKKDDLSPQRKQQAAQSMYC